MARPRRGPAAVQRTRPAPAEGGPRVHRLRDRESVTFTTRFAPSPTGPLHLGHAFSAMLAHDMATRAGGRFLLRIEDLDADRSKPEWEATILDDLRWLGLDWPEPVMRQSERTESYWQALDRLAELGLTYPCSCSRGDIRRALAAPQEGADPVAGPDGLVYPGTCRGRPLHDAGPEDAVRLDMAAALATLGSLPEWDETGEAPGRRRLDPEWMVSGVGDVVLARRGGGIAYHLAVVVDDAAQGVTHVVRGADLAEATAIHVLLQTLLGLPRPTYHHHRLIRDAEGRRLAKRDDARAIGLYRGEGATPADLRAMVDLPASGSGIDNGAAPVLP
ncbi:tRNA glutamyl-Q(34) synthetase GluQRS [Aquicoccus sp. SCR17]|nr:tRNA glutamyl-Q(34) synthetase GluQRS [Carideicomes alvinocaridis]